MKLYYFKESEFIRDENWFPLMSPRLLVLLDTFRHLTGECIISPHKDAIGRRNDTDSQHNVEKWGEVRAIDIFPELIEFEVHNQSNIRSYIHEWTESAGVIGLTGIGVYPEWTYKGKKRPGLHLDVRESASPGSPVTWGRIGNEYVSLDKAMEKIV